MKRRIEKASNPDAPRYFKGNHLAVIGHGDLMGWPAYTSYLDIEPELAIVTGNGGARSPATPSSMTHPRETCSFRR